ncbi:MAG: hypothetical protein ACO3JL_21575 [Myxococcota bacterium]
MVNDAYDIILKVSQGHPASRVTGYAFWAWNPGTLRCPAVSGVRIKSTASVGLESPMVQSDESVCATFGDHQAAIREDSDSAGNLESPGCR